ncbi:hypothetical protein JCM5350_007778 [Sporobolomyces pararoseus]
MSTSHGGRNPRSRPPRPPPAPRPRAFVNTGIQLSKWRPLTDFDKTVIPEHHKQVFVNHNELSTMTPEKVGEAFLILVRHHHAASIRRVETLSGLPREVREKVADFDGLYERLKGKMTIGMKRLCMSMHNQDQICWSDMCGSSTVYEKPKHSGVFLTVLSNGEFVWIKFGQAGAQNVQARVFATTTEDSKLCFEVTGAEHVNQTIDDKKMLYLGFLALDWGADTLEQEEIDWILACDHFLTDYCASSKDVADYQHEFRHSTIKPGNEIRGGRGGKYKDSDKRRSDAKKKERVNFGALELWRDFTSEDGAGIVYKLDGKVPGCAVVDIIISEGFSRPQEGSSVHDKIFPMSVTEQCFLSDGDYGTIRWDPTYKFIVKFGNFDWKLSEDLRTRHFFQSEAVTALTRAHDKIVRFELPEDPNSD